MFGIGMPELILIMAIALIVIGPKKLPDLARSLGRAMGEFKKATGELKSSLGVDEDLSQVKTAFDELNKDIKDTVTVDPFKADDTTSLDPSKKPSSSPESRPPEPQQSDSQSSPAEIDNGVTPVVKKTQTHDNLDDLNKKTENPIDDH